MKTIKRIAASITMITGTLIITGNAMAHTPGNSLRERLIKEFRDPGLIEHEVSDQKVTVYFKLKEDMSISTAKIDTDNAYLKRLITDRLHRIKLEKNKEYFPGKEYSIAIKFRSL